MRVCKIKHKIILAIFEVLLYEQCNFTKKKTFWKHVLQQETISSKTSRIISCIFERTLDIFEHSIECEWTCRDWRWLYAPPPFLRIKSLVQMIFFIILSTDVSVVVRIYSYMVQMYSQYVSESFVCSKFYIDADLTDLRKNSNNTISLFLAQSGLYWEILNWLPRYHSWRDTW